MSSSLNKNKKNGKFERLTPKNKNASEKQIIENKEPSKWQLAQIEYKNRAVYYHSLMKKNNYWTKNQEIINDYKKHYCINDHQEGVSTTNTAYNARL